MVFNIICAVVSILSLIYAAKCFEKCRELKSVADDYLSKWADTCGKLDHVCLKWDDTIELCQRIIKLNEELFDTNSELRELLKHEYQEDEVCE